MATVADGAASQTTGQNGDVTIEDGSGVLKYPNKLHGRAFYESLGSPKFVVAPMVDQSEFAWRMLTRSFMKPEDSTKVLAYSPMLHSRMFNETAKFRNSHFNPLRSGLEKKLNVEDIEKSDLYLDGHPSFDRPLFAQFCANDPSELLSAAEYVTPFCDAVDLNLGCPQGIARKGHYGAFLQEDQDLIYKLINNLHINLPVPVTAKIRVFETKEKTLDYAKNVLRAGASILTVHGRQRDQKGHKTGLADWSIIRYLRENLPKDTVLFTNGNILRREDLERCLAETGADAVMSAEGNLYDPTIFAEVPPIGEEGREFWRGKDGKGGYRMDAVFRRYMDIIYKYALEVSPPQRKPLFVPSDPPDVSEWAEGTEDDEDEQPAKKKRRQDKKDQLRNPNLVGMQPHLFHLLRALVSKHHDIRDALAKCRYGDIAAYEKVLQMVEKAVRKGLLEYESTNGKSIEEDWNNDKRLLNKPTEAVLDGNPDYESSVQTVLECKRPWWICQPYVRPLPAEALQYGSLSLTKKELESMTEEEKAKRGIKDHRAVDKAPVPARQAQAVDVTGHVETEKVNGSLETVEIPKAGLVCG